MTQIEEATVEFNAKISSVTKAETSQSFTAKFENGGSFRTTFASQRQATNTNTEKRDYSMRILVKARQASVPEGLQRVMDILQEAIRKRVDSTEEEA